jgi:hypothetical protein
VPRFFELDFIDWIAKYSHESLHEDTFLPDLAPPSCCTGCANIVYS